MSDQNARLEQLLDVMSAIARQEFDVKAPVGTDGDVIDAIGLGLNMLVDELRGEVASRRELERAHADLKQAQAQLVHAGKLAAIGQLAAGVAHEINNPMQGIQACLEILKRTEGDVLAGLARGELSVTEAQRILESSTALADAEEAIDRIRGVTAALRTFARADDDEVTSVPLDDVVRVSCRLSESNARLRATLELDLEPVAPVRGCRGKLGQVVTNLLVNAIQAIPEGAAERHVIRLGLRQLDGTVSLTIEDSGPGIPEAERARVFEPFFTTKPAELGTGLGLALAADIVRAHEGTISVGDSGLGGARFEVRLPATERADPTPAQPALMPRARRSRVLLVDDEPMLLRLFRSVLARESDVVMANSGAAALEILNLDRRFDLVVCDLQMPGVDGVEVYERAIGIAPELAPVFVIATGGAVTSRGTKFLDQTRVRVLRKPFEIEALLALVRGE